MAASFFVAKSLSGVSNLEDATCLEMLVNTDEQSLGNFGAMLPNLVQLKLSNSVISTVSGAFFTFLLEMAGYEYRKSIHQAVPRLKILDDEPFLVEKVGGKDVLRDMPESAKSARVPNHLKEEWQLISNALKTVENEQEETEPSKPVAAARPASARKNTRPKTAMSRQRPSSAMRQRPGSSIGQRPGSSLGSSGNSFELSGIFQGDDSSDLTHGSGEVICGNISKALKARRKNIKAFNSVIPPFTTNSPIHTPEKSYEEENNKQFPSKHDVFTELREWRQQFAK
ncbi:leucine-rich repeat-containing protein 56-like [Actinia tenebrosa]|uniref:Leucine-rich repeat-containing protein 56-like n=1 Tax=Actinia tenebrosa TaxID=6105 RepID=A0A6P8J6R6_ACTTE|nr:leucine-rich repeat-containing protein 56-like [Actinia tenebrosa]